ncbi:hypothetical protein [Proteus terrae]
MAKKNNALESMKKWMEFIPQCLQPKDKQAESKDQGEKPASKKQEAEK